MGLLARDTFYTCRQAAVAQNWPVLNICALLIPQHHSLAGDFDHSLVTLGLQKLFTRSAGYAHPSSQVPPLYPSQGGTVQISCAKSAMAQRRPANKPWLFNQYERTVSSALTRLIASANDMRRCSNGIMLGSCRWGLEGT